MPADQLQRASSSLGVPAKGVLLCILDASVCMVSPELSPVGEECWGGLERVPDRDPRMLVNTTLFQ